MNLEAILRNFENILYPALLETLYMSFTATFLAFLIALIPAIVLTVTDKGGLWENKSIYSVLDFIINILRSFPFLVLIVVLSPFTKYLIGVSIGTTATIVPLTIGIAPYLAKMIESAFKEIDPAIIEAARSYGASKAQIIFKVMFSEALPSVINGITLILIIVIGFSAMAGTVGGGGLGDVAIRYGYERFRTDIMIQTVVILIILVQIIQFIGNILYKITKR
ncbi:ABC transporter permease [Campylobacter lari]|uniref:ABC transporter permease subunit n=1 Tax=Campylobacter lari TaxID=201 RepID=A0A5L4MMT0_CAMLA|nr:DL-methionine ABC transporter MetINQ, permease protein [Campylobacter lari subsp. concheus LMG 11760]EAH7030954.1 ABC transporter permease [Campylobacter lari]EAH8850974.1 ABC transporter permease [Campylobacter lari]EAH9952857.1 ABC transporter permease [Campylobacter lari]EAI1237308.1 ABC transporter permease [Campylobacter lari]